MPNVRSPQSVIHAQGCSAKVLSLSDQHATILLSVPQNNDGTELERSLLKLMVVPHHREFLTSEEDQDNEEVSKNVLSFLDSLSFHQTSESGAEYSYYNATPKESLVRGVMSKIQSFVSGLLLLAGQLSTVPFSLPSFKVELISPASDRQVQRATPAPKRVLIEETPEMYEAATKPFVQTVLDSGSLSWVQNVVDGTKERERLLLDKEEYILNVDTKWRSHPDALTVPRNEWHRHKSVADLYCLAIAKDGTIHSLRDLRRKHIPMLRSIMKDAPEEIEKIYGVARDQLRIFVHYVPQFFHFHVHFTRLENEIGCQVERGHLVSDIIQNLEMDDMFYTKRIISFKLPTNDKLYQHVKQWRTKSDGVP